jgi:hypothetical protein
MTRAIRRAGVTLATQLRERTERGKKRDTQTWWARAFRRALTSAVVFSAPAAASLGLGVVATGLAAVFPLIGWLIWTGKPDRFL